jgi:hypothetical protein
MACFSQGIRILTAVNRSHPTDLGRAFLLNNYLMRGQTRAVSGNLSGSLRDADEAICLAEDNPDRARELRLYKARYAAMGGDRAQALGIAEEMSPGEGDGDGKVAYLVACVYALCVKDAKVTGEQPRHDGEVANYVNLVLQFLQKASDEGFFDKPERIEGLLSERDFHALREMPQFRQFVDRLTAPQGG